MLISWSSLSIMNSINGVNKIAVFFRNGIYNKFSGTYCLNIDGDFIYNMAKSEMEEEETKKKRTHSLNEEYFKTHTEIEARISARAHAYIHFIIDNLAKLLSRVPDHVVIFLCSGPSYFRESCRTCFFDIISINPCMSSTQMYVQRNQNYNLNVFLTHDADIFIRAYNHEAFIMDNLDFRIESDPKTYTHKYTNNDGFSDTNVSYNHTDGISVRDSCIWLCPKIMDRLCVISFDSLKVQAGFFPRHFRILAAMCGNDYIDGILSDSMILGIMNINTTDRITINGLSNIMEIVTAFIYLGLKYNGTPKTAKKITIYKFESDEFAYFDNSIRNYLRFIETGVAPRWDMSNKYNSINILHSIIKAMSGNTTEPHHEWTNKSSLTLALFAAKFAWYQERTGLYIPPIELGNHTGYKNKSLLRLNPFYNIFSQPPEKPKWKIHHDETNVNKREANKVINARFCSKQNKLFNEKNFPPLAKPTALKAPSGYMEIKNEKDPIYWPMNVEAPKLKSTLTLKLDEHKNNSVDAKKDDENKTQNDSSILTREEKIKLGFITDDKEVCSITGRMQTCSIDIPVVSSNSTFFPKQNI